EDAVPYTLFGSIPSGAYVPLHVVPGDYVLVVSGGPSIVAATPFTVAVPPDSALLWGTAVFDTDGDGQPDPEEAPATVEVVIGGSDSVRTAPPVRADGRGRYLLWPVEPGVYSIEADTPFRSATWLVSVLTPVGTGQAARIDLLLQPEGNRIGAESARCFPETGFCVGQDTFWAAFTARGGVATYGYPISRAFPFLGCLAQFFQRHVLHQCRAGEPIWAMNLLDPAILPYNRIDGATFPAHDPEIAAAAPPPDTAAYAAAVLAHVQATVPDTFEGASVGFLRTFLKPAGAEATPDAALNGLAVWGFPTSRPAFDPNNLGFVYQRFQRGIMHYSAATGETHGILLGDWFKRLITGENLPADLAGQAADSHFLRQHCASESTGVCRPSQLENTDLTSAFERHLQ
ncbi:MAG: hypothetical protein ACRDJN_05390, partial [Chloroflexota bacterium]